jgi:hypothetical protein
MKMKKEIVDYFEITSPFLKNVEAIKSPIYQDQDSKYFGTKDKKSFYAIDSELSVLKNLKDWITNLEFYTHIPGMNWSKDWANTIRVKLPDNAIDITELNNFINEFLELIELEDKRLISILNEVENTDSIHYVFSHFQKARITGNFNHNYGSTAKFYFNDILDTLNFHNPELKTKYFDLWDFIIKTIRNQLKDQNYDLTKSPFWQIIINPKMEELKRLCYSPQTETNDVKEAKSFDGIGNPENEKRQYLEKERWYREPFYSIDTQKAKLKNTSSELVEIEISKKSPPQIVPPDHLITTTPIPINEFDLVNKNEYDHLGNIIVEAKNPEDYDRDFSVKLITIKPLYRIEDFLLYHYNNTHDKEQFLKHLEFHTLLHWMQRGITSQPQRDKFVRLWIDKVKGQNQIEVTPPQTEKKGEQPPPEIKPVFKTESIDQIFDLLKIHFSTEHQTQLKQIIKSGGNSTEPLLFKGSGKTFLDFLKQLMKGQFLSIAVQLRLEEWVSNHFKYLHNGKEKSFTLKYASKIISGNERAAKGNRLIDINLVNNKFEIMPLEIKNRQK